MINPDEKFISTKVISIENTDIDSGTDTIRNITKVVYTAAEPKKISAQHGKSNKIKSKVDSNFNDQKEERREEEINGKNITIPRY